MRWCLLEEILNIEKGHEAKSRAFYPDEIYDPKVLLLEMMAQTCGVLIGAEADYGQDFVLTKIQNAQFEENSHGIPGAELAVKAVCDSPKSEGAWFHAQVSCAGHEIARAEILLMNIGHLIKDKKTSVTFHPAFMERYQVRQKLSFAQEGDSCSKVTDKTSASSNDSGKDL